MSEEVISKSKQKREARKEEVKKAKGKQTLDSIIGWVIALVIAGAIIAVIVAGIISSVKSSNLTVSSSDYSVGLTDEGFVAKADLSKVKDLDLNNLVVPFSEVEFTDANVEETIDSMISNYKEYSTDSTLTVASGDSVNIDFTGYMDDVAFEGGSTDGAGYTLTIGSGSFIDNFEDQLIGTHPGDKVEVNVTFPEVYDNNPDYAGKAAKFDVTVNSIQVTPEFNDEFVVKNLSEGDSKATTADEYRAYVKQAGYENNIKTYISNYILENSEVKSLPKEYVSNLKGLIKYNDEATYNYYNSYYYAYLGTYLYNSFSDYTQMTDEEYENTITGEAEQQAAANITYQKYFKDNNLTVSTETYELVVSLFGDNAETTYSKQYLAQAAMKYTVIEHVAALVSVQ